jgi:hypothetical protein
MLRKIIVWAVVLFVIFGVAIDPAGAAGYVHDVYDFVHVAANSAAQFVKSL